MQSIRDQKDRERRPASYAKNTKAACPMTQQAAIRHHNEVIPRHRHWIHETGYIKARAEPILASYDKRLD